MNVHAAIRIAKVDTQVGEVAVVAVSDYVAHSRERLDELRKQVELSLKCPVVIVGPSDNQMLGRPELMRRVVALDCRELSWQTVPVGLLP